MCKKNYIGFICIMLCSFILSCGAPVKNLAYRPSESSPEKLTIMKKEIIDKALQIGTQKGYAILGYDYDKGMAKFEKRYIDIVWIVNISTYVKDGELAVNIYAPGGGKYPTGSGPDMDAFYDGLKGMYSNQKSSTPNTDATEKLGTYKINNLYIVQVFDQNYQNKPSIIFAAFENNDLHKLVSILVYEKSNAEDMKLINEFNKMSDLDKKRYIKKTFFEIAKFDLGAVE